MSLTSYHYNSWAISRAHFNPRLVVRAKLGLSRAHNKFMTANIAHVVLSDSDHEQKLGINPLWSLRRVEEMEMSLELYYQTQIRPP